MNSLDVPKNLKWAGIVLVCIIGLIHLIESPEYFEFAVYLGLAFLLNAAGSAVAAVGIYRGERLWGWSLGAVILAGAFVMFLVSRTVGLPGLTEREWEPVGILSLIVEGLFLGLYLRVVAMRSPETESGRLS